MRKITDTLYQGCFDDLIRLPEECNVVIGVGNASTTKRKIPDIFVYGPEIDKNGARVKHLAAIPERVFNLKTFHIPLIEMSMTPGWKEKWPRSRHRISSHEEIIAVLEVFYKLYKQGKTVFCHCDAGICRSVGICAGFLVRSGQYETIEEAYLFVSQQCFPGYEGSHKYDDHNVFDATLKEVCDSKYWLEIDEYTDQLNGYANL